MDAEQNARLRDILEAVRRIEFYIAGVSKEDFSKNGEKQDAVIRRIEISGFKQIALSEDEGHAKHRSS